MLSAETASWVDGTPVDYSNWPGRSPNTKVLPADACATMKAVDGVWQLAQCSQPLGFVCKTVASSKWASPSASTCWGGIGANSLNSMVSFKMKRSLY